MDFKTQYFDNLNKSDHITKTFLEARELLASDSNLDIVQVRNNILLPDIYQIDHDNKVYVEIELKRQECDIATNFRLIIPDNIENPKMCIRIGSNIKNLNNDHTIILASCMYTPIYIRITFDNMPSDDVYLRYTSYIYNYKIREKIMYENPFILCGIRYFNGMAVINQ